MAETSDHLALNKNLTLLKCVYFWHCYYNYGALGISDGSQISTHRTAHVADRFTPLIGKYQIIVREA